MPSILAALPLSLAESERSSALAKREIMKGQHQRRSKSWCTADSKEASALHLHSYTTIKETRKKRNSLSLGRLIKKTSRPGTPPSNTCSHLHSEKREDAGGYPARLSAGLQRPGSSAGHTPCVAATVTQPRLLPSTSCSESPLG
ncbi:hypothetical protein E3U43_007653, partial [Larimichthys crocea]